MQDTPNTSFSELALHSNLIENLASLNYQTMTPIQASSLPLMLKGHDVIAQAKTGSGKTAAFGLSVLQHLRVEKYAVQALILCPTRELAEQVSIALRQLARLMPNVKILNLSGGSPLKPQLDSLRHGAHIIVGTPGRIQKHIDKATLSLKHINTLVLDEADRMLDMGFLEDIKKILQSCPKQRQTLLFSATYPAEIKSLSKQFMRDAKEVIVETEEEEHDIENIFYDVKQSTLKFPLLKTLLLHHKPTSTLIFCNTKQQTADLRDQLDKAGFSALALHGDLEQFDRDQILIRFVNGSCSILVATDVAARGLDIKELPAVVNYELAFQPEVHTHRIGRTGRAGHKGLAFSFVLPNDYARMEALKEANTTPIIMGNANDLPKLNGKTYYPDRMTVCLNAGKKDKIRPGDILGALTKDAGLPSEAIGKINITALYSYVAIRNDYSEKAYDYLQSGKLKGRKVQAKRLR